MAEFKVAVIGATGKGDYGHGHDVVWKQIPGCTIVGVADHDSVGRDAAAQRLSAPAFADYRTMLDQVRPDIVSVAPRWLDQHADMVLSAAERGIHVYMEKPFCRNLEEADAIVAAVRKHNVKLAIAHQTRYSPLLPVIRNLIEDGAIGTVLELRGRGKEDRRGGGEDLWVLGSHIFNLMHYFGGEPNWCFASVQQDGRPIETNDIVQGNEGIGPIAGDSIDAMFGFADGVTGYFGSHRNAGAGGQSRFGLRIVGSQGQIEILTGHMPAAHILQDPLWSPGRSGKQWQRITTKGIGQIEPIADGGLPAGNKLVAQDLLDAIQEDRLPEANVFEARNTIEMIMAVFQSGLTQAKIAMPLAQRAHPLAAQQ
ncbi:MAG: Gfo/Idh/MocA family oxidoreductase [Pirellulaceae bacterium]